MGARCVSAAGSAGSPDVRAQSGPGLGFEFATPRAGWRKLLRPITPTPAWQPNPVRLGDHLKAFCPPNYPDMASAVDAIVAEKYGPKGLYTTPDGFAPVFKPGLAQRFVDEVPHLQPEVIACAKDICSYIYNTYGRFPAHVDAFHVPVIWIQAHHLALDYYDSILCRRLYGIAGHARPQLASMIERECFGLHDPKQMV